MGRKSRKPLRCRGFERFEKVGSFFKKSVDKTGRPCYNNQRCRERRKPLKTTAGEPERQARTILENDTEKSHFVQEE